MNYWAKLGAGVAVAGALVGLWFADEHYTQKEAEEKKLAGLALNFDEDEVRKVSLELNDQRFVFERADLESDWKMLEPTSEIPADQDAVNNFVAALKDIRKERSLALDDVSKERLRELGLDEPRRVMSLEVDSEEKSEALTLRIGKDVQIGSSQGAGFRALSVYARLDDAAEVILVPASVLSSTDRDLSDFRTKKVVDFQRQDVVAFTYEGDGQTIRVAKEEENWSLVLNGEKTLPADENNISLYLDRVQRLRADRVVEQEDLAPLSEYGLGDRARKIQFFGDNDAVLFTLAVGQAKNETHVVMADGALAKLPASEFDELVPDAQKFRDMKVMRDVDFAEIKRLVTASGKVYQREGQRWYLMGDAAEGSDAERTSRSEASTLYSNFEFMRAESIIEADEKKGLKEYGLDDPFLSFVFEFSEDSDMEKLTVSVGNRVEGDEKNIFLMRDGSDAIYVTETTWMDALATLDGSEGNAQDDPEVPPQAKKED